MLEGWESYIAHGIKHSRPSKSYTIPIGNLFDFYWHAFQTRLFDRHGLGSKRATKCLVRKIRKINPDIIHIHNLHGYYINIEILFQYLSSISTPVVWTIHDCWPFTGHCTYFDMVNCEKWKTECENCPQKKAYPASFLADRSRDNFYLKRVLFNLPKNLTLVPVSDWLKGLLGKSFLQEIPARVIHNGQDLTVFKHKSTQTLVEKYGLRDDFIILGVANRWNERKGLKDFLALSKLLSKNEKIVLVGLSVKQFQALPKNIIGVKRTKSLEELSEFYSLANVLVNPTYEESFGMVNIEALACGTPVITYCTGGSPETISKETGFVVEKGQVDKIMDCIRKIKVLRGDYFIKACRERAETYFDKNVKYREYLNLYDELSDS
jgi:glycosyltransferase involved in cell wall biosynthesis